MPDAKALAAMLQPGPHGIGRPITDRAAWEEIAARPGVRAAVVAAAEAMQADPAGELTEEHWLEFFQSGRWTNWQTRSDRRRYSLSVLTLAECLENRGRFLPAIEKDIAAMCAERVWVQPASDRQKLMWEGKAVYVDLISAMTAWGMATADWLLGDRLAPETRRTMRAEVERRVFAPYLSEVRGETKEEWWVNSPFNWNAVVHAGIVGAAVVFIDDADRRAEIVAHAAAKVKIYLTGFKPDGYTGEGLGYWSYGFSHYALLAETLLAATGGKLNLYADDRARTVAQLPRKLEMTPNVYPAFADAGVNDQPLLWLLDVLDRRYGFGWQVVLPGQRLGTAPGASLYITAFIWFFDPAAPAVVPPSGPATATAAADRRREWLPDAQVYVGRPTQDSQETQETLEMESLSLAFKGGNNGEPHGHLDLGTYVVAADRDQLVADPGAPVYVVGKGSDHGEGNPLRNSHDHSLPVVAGQFQQPGKEHRAEVTEQSFGDRFDRVTLDLTKGYDVPALESLTRRFEYDHAALGATTVTDSAQFSSPQTFGTALVTLGEFRQIVPHEFIVRYRHSALALSIDTGGAPFTTVEEPITGELRSGNAKPRRLGINLTDPTRQARITLSLRPLRLSPSDLPVSPQTLAQWQPAEAGAIRTLAANLVGEAGGKVAPTVAVGSAGGAVRRWSRPGHALTWRFQVPTKGTYGLRLRSCGAEDADTVCKLRVDGKPLAHEDETYPLPPTGGWSAESDDWRTVWLAHGNALATCPLPPGDHEVTLINVSGHSQLDWVELVPLKGPLAR